MPRKQKNHQIFLSFWSQKIWKAWLYIPKWYRKKIDTRPTLVCTSLKSFVKGSWSHVYTPRGGNHGIGSEWCLTVQQKHHQRGCHIFLLNIKIMAKCRVWWVLLRTLACNVFPEGSDVQRGSFMSSHPKIDVSSPYNTPVKTFLLEIIFCRIKTRMAAVKENGDMCQRTSSELHVWRNIKAN